MSNFAQRSNWQKINSDADRRFLFREFPLICPISQTEIVIAGGYINNDKLSDIQIFDTATRRISTALSNSQVKLTCLGPAVVAEEGAIVALAMGEIWPMMVRYDYQSNQLRNFRTIQFEYEGI